MKKILLSIVLTVFGICTWADSYITVSNVDLIAGGNYDEVTVSINNASTYGGFQFIIGLPDDCQFVKVGDSYIAKGKSAEKHNISAVLKSSNVLSILGYAMPSASLSSESNEVLKFYVKANDGATAHKEAITFNDITLTTTGYVETTPEAIDCADAISINNFTTKLNKAGFATYSVNANVNVATSGVDAYYAKLSDDNTITLYSIDGYIPAGTGVIVYYGGEGKDGKEVSFSLATEGSAAEIVDNCLIATSPKYNQVFKDSPSVYALGDGNVFLKYTKGTAVIPNRAYIDLGSNMSAKIRMVFDGEATAIKNVENSADNTVSYNLAGQRVNSSAKGIVVKNGHKFIVK